MIATANVNTRGQQVITVWRVADGQVLEEFGLWSSAAVSISFSADGKQIAIVDNHGLLILTEVKIKVVNVNG